MVEEIWKDIPGIHTHQISNMGNLRSKNSISIVKNAKRLGTYTRKLKGKNLRIHKRYINNQQRYVHVQINDKPYLLHRLVAKTFLAKQYFEGAHVNHKNGDKHDNRVENLEWVTASKNELHSYRILGKTVWNKGTNYINPLAIKIRRENYLNACRALLVLKTLVKCSDKKLAEFLNMSRRQLNQNLQVARKGGD